MVSEEIQSSFQILNVVKEVFIAAPADVVFETVLEPHGPMKDMNMKLEAWVGGTESRAQAVQERPDGPGDPPLLVVCRHDGDPPALSHPS